jgi:hypothetical protein
LLLSCGKISGPDRAPPRGGTIPASQGSSPPLALLADCALNPIVQILGGAFGRRIRGPADPKARSNFAAGAHAAHGAQRLPE